MTAAPAIASAPTEHQVADFLSLVLGEGYGEFRTFAKSSDAEERQALANSLREFVKMENGVVTEPHKVARYLKGCKQHKFNAYVAMATRSKEGAQKGKGTGEYCQNIQVLFLDLDFKNERGEDGARELLAKFPVRPSFTVESGAGIHVYFLIAPLYLKTAQQYPLAQRLLKALANHFKGSADIGVSQPAAVLRLPGTLNYKYDPPRLVRFVEGTGRTYDLDTDFGDLLKDAAVEPPSSQGYKCPDQTVTGERHTSLYKLLRSQKARNIPLDVALVGCHALNEKHCEPPIPRKKLDAYLRRVWDQENSPEFDKKKKAQQAGPERFDDVPVDGEETKKLTCIPFTTIERKDPEHLFGKRLWRGSPTLLVGEGGVAKGFVLADIAARFTTGTSFIDALPSEHRYTRASNVAVLLTEDADSTFKGRFEAAGGDIERIVTLSSTEQVAGMNIRSPVFLEDDLAELIRELKEREIDLLIIETLVEHMGNRTGKRLPNTSNELEVRNQLRRLLAVCQAADIYCIAVMHPRKGNTGKAIESPSGSRGFTNAARSVLFCYMDPPTEEKPAEDNPVRLLSTGKANYVAKEPPTLRFKVNSFIGDAFCGCADLRECEHPARVDWFQGEELYDERTAQEVVETEQNGEKKHPPAKQKAMNFLEALIQPDGWIRIPAVPLEEMALERGITKNSLYAAKKELGLSSRRENKVRGKVYAWLTTEADDADLLVDGDEGVVPDQGALHDF